MTVLTARDNIAMRLKTEPFSLGMGYHQITLSIQFEQSEPIWWDIGCVNPSHGQDARSRNLGSTFCHSDTLLIVLSQEKMKRYEHVLSPVKSK